MPTNRIFKKDLLYPELSYRIAGFCFQTHNELGRFGREKQYADLLELKFKEAHLQYKRELIIGNTGNVADFLIEDNILVELKAKPFITKEDYFQVQRYLNMLKVRLGLIVNFRSRYLVPKRVILIETKRPANS